MLKESFILLDRVGPASERKVWQSVPDWDGFRQAKRVNGIATLRKGFYDRQLDKAEAALRAEAVEHFASVLPPSQQWRLWEEFKEQAVFLDIETSGFYGDVTVVGLYDGLDTKTMVRGVTFDKGVLKKELAQYKLLVTFNGRSFDVPVLERYFKGVVPDIPHIATYSPDIPGVIRMHTDFGAKDTGYVINHARLPLGALKTEEGKKVGRVSFSPDALQEFTSEMQKLNPLFKPGMYHTHITVYKGFGLNGYNVLNNGPPLR